ncbi:MAG: flagellin FliC [Chromatiales bacterium]|nr:flagellin FliC [Chromatiales bacterium]
MAQVINTNVFSLNSQRQLNKSQASLQVSLERLSSGLRINRAKDDAAGLAISQRFTAQVRGLEQANRNANDGISLLQTAEGAMDEIANSLQRMRELAVQARNGTVNSADKASLNDEFTELAAEITRITDTAEFNNTNLLGTSATLTFQVGFENGSTNQIKVSTIDLATKNLSVGGIRSVLTGLAISTSGSASAAIGRLDTAIDNISAKRADFGAKQNRLEATVRNNANIVENQSAARSRILDADFARETANLTRNQILQQAGVAMLSQANALPQSVLSLLG